MPTPAAPNPISLADCLAELGRSAGQTISLNDRGVRNLTGGGPQEGPGYPFVSGTISLGDLRSKTWYSYAMIAVTSGGGGGASSEATVGGGGGGGGGHDPYDYFITKGAMTLTIGGGGAGGIYRSDGGDGGMTIAANIPTVLGGFSSYPQGGGGGGWANGRDGASGGGGGFGPGSGGSGLYDSHLGTFPGFNGGAGKGYTHYWAGGGGGGGYNGPGYDGHDGPTYTGYPSGGSGGPGNTIYLDSGYFYSYSFSGGGGGGAGGGGGTPGYGGIGGMGGGGRGGNNGGIFMDYVPWALPGSAQLGGGGGGGFGGASEFGTGPGNGANGGSGSVLVMFDSRDVRVSYSSGIARADSTASYQRHVWIQSSGTFTFLGG